MTLARYIGAAHPRPSPFLFPLLPPLSLHSFERSLPPTSSSIHFHFILPSPTLHSPLLPFTVLLQTTKPGFPSLVHSLRKNQTALQSLQSRASVPGPHSYLQVAGLVKGHPVSRIPSACKSVSKIFQSFNRFQFCGSKRRVRAFEVEIQSLKAGSKVPLISSFLVSARPGIPQTTISSVNKKDVLLKAFRRTPPAPNPPKSTAGGGRSSVQSPGRVLSKA